MIEFNKRKFRAWSMNGPSGAVGAAVSELGEICSDFVMLTADLCFFSGLNRYIETYPNRLINVGIAEQNMVGIAAGMAKEGFVPFVSTYASFVMRCADQIRVNMSYMNLPIKFLGLTAGCSNGKMGATHMSIEDLSLMRSLPNITVISPADCAEIVKAIIAASETDVPTYIRLTGNAVTPMIYSEDYEFVIGKAIEVCRGNDVCIIATGSMVYQAIQASKLLEENGFSITVINMHTIKPLDVETLDLVAETHRLIVTVEEHSVYGGLFSAIAEYYIKNKVNVPVIPIGMDDCFLPAGSYQWQLEQYGLTSTVICKNVIEKLK